MVIRDSIARNRWAYAVLLGEVLIFYRYVLFRKGFGIPWDLRYYHLPLASIMAQAFRRFEFPLWDTSTYCGRPFYALLQGQAFYPPAWVTALLSNLTGGNHLLYLVQVQVVAHVLLAGIFTFGLLRALKLGTAASLAGATIFQLGAYFVSQAQHLGAVNAAAWMPAAWHAVVLLGQGFRWRRVAGLAVALAMSFLAGFPSTTAAVFGSTALLAAGLAVSRLARLRLVVWTGAGFLWSLALAAVQWYPSRELERLSVAAGRARWATPESGMALQALASLVWPDRWGVFEFPNNNWSLPWNPTFLYLYCGIPALVFAAAALVRRWRRETAVFGAVTVAFALWMLGGSTSVGRTVLPRVPGSLRGAVYPEFGMAAFLLGLAVLAAFGAEVLLARRPRWVQAFALIVVAADLTAVGAGRTMNTTDDPGITYRQIDGVREAPEGLRALVRRTDPPSRIDNFGGSPTWTGCSPAFDVPSSSGDDPLALTRVVEVRRLFGKCMPWERYCEVINPDSPVLHLLNAEYLLARRGAPAPSSLELAGEYGSIAVYRDRRALPRFFLVGRTVRAASMEEALGRLRAPDFDPQQTAIVEGDAEAAGGTGQVKVVRYGAREIGLETDAARGAMLVTSEAWYPGWRAWVDGRERPLVLTNAAFRGLPVPAGRHTVRMRFEPAVLWWSAAISFAALAALLAAVILERRPASGGAGACV